MEISLPITLSVLLLASGEDLEPKISILEPSTDIPTDISLLDLIKDFVEAEDDAECLASMKNTLQQAIEMIELELELLSKNGD